MRNKKSFITPQLMNLKCPLYTNYLIKNLYKDLNKAFNIKAES